MMAGQYPALKSAEAFATTDFRPELPHLNVPTLVIHGAADETVPIDATSRALAEQLPHASRVEYEGAPHAIFATQQDRLAQDLLHFLARPARDVINAGRRMFEAA